MLCFFTIFLLVNPLQAEGDVISKDVEQTGTTRTVNATTARFNQTMMNLYQSPESLVRVLAYINTMKIPQSAVLEKALRERLPQSQSMTEQYIIMYTLASITRSEHDFAHLMKHVFKFPYVVSYASYVEGSVRISYFEFTEIYPWMVRNNVYKRDAWLCGIISAGDIRHTLTTEAEADYLAAFPEGELDFKFLRGADADDADAYLRAGLSQAEIAWMNDYDIPQEESDWVSSCTMPYMEMSLLNEAWGRTFDAFLPLMDLGGKDAELARTIAAPALKLSNPGGKYNRLLAE
jgi:hypothetical protein